MQDWYGVVKDVKFKWNGPMSDPELVYKGLEFNYWDIFEALMEIFLEDNGNDFGDWVENNQDTITGYLDDVIHGAYFNETL